MSMKVHEKLKKIASSGNIGPQDGVNQETCMKLGQLVNNMTQSFDFTLVQPSMYTIIMVIKIWTSRRVYGQDKKLTLKLEKPRAEKQQIIELFYQHPSIILYIDDEKIENNNLIKSQNFMYYQGTKESMFIYYQQTGSRYYGQVKSLQNIEPHGYGSKYDSPGTKQQVIYQGNFTDGKKQGQGREVKKNTQYEGFWENNQKHGWGLQLIRRKKKLGGKSEKIKSSQVSEKSQEKEQKQKQVQLEQGQQEIKQKQQSSEKQSEQKTSKNLNDLQVKQMLKSFRVIYEGPFQKGQRCGSDGVQYTRHGTYTGEWSNNAKNGKGKIVYKGGAQYQGCWKNNFFQGAGKYTDEAKNVYQGQFVNGQFEGQGVMKYVNGDEYQGSWSQGKKHGKGVYTYEDGDYYDGQWIKDSAEGNGSSMIKGVLYQGEFKKGMREGIGQQTTQDGDEIKGIWKKNQRIQTISINGQITEG